MSQNSCMYKCIELLIAKNLIEEYMLTQTGKVPSIVCVSVCVCVCVFFLFCMDKFGFFGKKKKQTHTQTITQQTKRKMKPCYITWLATERVKDVGNY